jgi:hypothetical protein
MGTITGRQEIPRVTHHRHSHWNVSDADAVVDESSRPSLGVPPFDIGRAHFELERGGHPAAHLMAIGLWSLAVGVKIDEAGRDDESSSVDDRPTREGGSRNRRDGSAADADISHLVQARLWINDTAVRDHQIKGLRVEQCRETDRNRDDQRACVCRDTH